MRPILISFGPFKISSLGFFLFWAFWLFTFLVWRRSKEKLYPEETVFDSIFLVTIAGFLGARLFYVFLNWEKFGFNFLKWLLFNGYPGFYFYGGFLLAIFTLYCYYRRVEGVPFWEMADFFAQGFWLSFLVGEIGVFLDGGEVGKVSGLPWAMRMVGYEGRRHPVSLYKILLLFLAFLLFRRFWRERERAFGQFALYFLLIFSLLNFLVDFWRQFSVYYWQLGFSQWVSAVLILLSSVFLYRRGGGRKLKTKMGEIVQLFHCFINSRMRQ